MKTITVEDLTWKTLQELKIASDQKTLNDVIVNLIEKNVCVRATK